MVNGAGRNAGKKGLFVRERMNKESKEMAGGQELEPPIDRSRDYSQIFSLCEVPFVLGF